jgi:hypothetical protein
MMMEQLRYEGRGHEKIAHTKFLNAKLGQV